MSKSLAVPEEAPPGEDEVIVIRTTQAKLKEAENKILDIQHFNEVPASLGNLSAATCAFQFIQAAILFIVASQVDQEWNWFTSYPDTDGFSVPQPTKIASFSILYFSPVFIAMSGFEHLSCLVFRETYSWYIARNQNPFRWTEYTFSAALMRVMVAQLVGITDIHLLFCMFVMTSITIQCGATFEVVNAKARADGLAKNWSPFYVAWISHLASWFVIFSYFIKGASASGQDGFVWALVLIIFFLDGAFAVLFTLQWAQVGIFEDYTTGEHVFIMLSFTSKTLLAWITFIAAFNQYLD